MAGYDPVEAKLATQKIHIEDLFKMAYRVTIDDAYELARLALESNDPSWHWLLVFADFRSEIGRLEQIGELPWKRGPFWEG